MPVTSFAQREHTKKMQYGETALSARIARWCENEEISQTPVPGLTLYRFDAPTQKTSYMMAPSICLIGQGRKRVMLGEDHFDYDAHHFLITSVDLPIVANITEASPEKPYLGLTLELDLRTIAQQILDNHMPSANALPDRRAMAVSKVSGPLLDAFHRLLDLLDKPEDIPALAPLIRQEISYRLLMSEQGARLRQITSTESHSYQIARTIDWLKANFQQSFRVEDLASKAGLSASAFHSHFRSMTAMSPLQFQKRLRLNEARRLMLTERMDASSAAFEVGYESPSQFSREYSRHFGAPPARDIKSLMQVASG